MAFTPAELAAIARAAALTAVQMDTNNGYETLFPQGLNDLALIAKAIEREGLAAVAAAAEALLSRDAAGVFAANAAREALAAKGSSDAAAALAASFQIDPVARLVAPPTKDIRFLPDVTPADVSAVRSGVGTRRNRFGLMESIAANAARHDYDPVTGAYRGALVEPASTNLFTYSSDFSNAAWGKNASSIAAAAAVPGLAAGVVAQKLVESADNSRHEIARSLTVSDANPKTITWHVAPAERTRAEVRFTDGIVDPSSAIVNLQTGALEGGLAARMRVRRDKDGFWIISTTVTPSAANAAVVCRLGLVSPASTIYAGDGASGIYVRFAQFETLPIETSPIPTTDATVARQADNLSAAVSSTWLNPSETTFFWEGTPGVSLGGTAEEALFSLDDGTLNNYVMLYRNAARRIGVVAVSQNAGGNVVFSIVSNYLVNDFTPIRVALTTNRLVSRLSLNGVSVEIAHRAGSDWVLSRLANLRLGHRVSTGTHMLGHYRRFLATPRYLTAAEIEALTRI